MVALNRTYWGNNETASEFLSGFLNCLSSNLTLCKKDVFVSFSRSKHSTRGTKGMARFTSKLDNIRVAAPCSADWDSMFGNERVRLCKQCHLNVYNLSEMSRVEADRLINQAEGRLCVRFYRRRDGSIITQNCPVGLRAIKRRVSRVATAVASFILSLMAGVSFYRFADTLRSFEPHVMGHPIAPADENRPLPPSIESEVFVSPSPEDFVMGKMVPIQTRRMSVPRFKQHRSNARPKG